MAVSPDKKPSISKRWEAYQPTKTGMLWACVACVAATLVVGFTWGGWMTGAKARDASEASADAARSKLVAEICVDRFNAADGSSDRLTELNAITSSYKRREFVEAGGWATMPGEKSASRNGADACAEALAA
tara:strand:- start:507 stop:899 length:393 start_codon:yes stop_codon:yes gene_type:complete